MGLSVVEPQGSKAARRGINVGQVTVVEPLQRCGGAVADTISASGRHGHCGLVREGGREGKTNGGKEKKELGLCSTTLRGSGSS